MYRRGNNGLAVLLVHPGGPFWARRDTGAWSIPKGEANLGEQLRDVAVREFAEELGAPPQGLLQPLGEVRQAGGKRVTAFAVEGDFDTAALRSNTFEMEWPPRSGRIRTFPEVDRAEWFTLPLAAEKILAGQRPLLDRLQQLIGE
ncbi:NUDIX domain-containing protein [Bordetella flabilis]|nr:NUDIX domain-containing protein [Bordetella flabilis]